MHDLPGLRAFEMQLGKGGGHGEGGIIETATATWGRRADVTGDIGQKTLRP